MIGGIEWSHMYRGFLRLFARAAYHGDPELADTLVRPVATKLREMVREMLSVAAERGEIRAGVDLDATERIVHALTIAVGDSSMLPYLNNYFQVMDEGFSIQRSIEALIALTLEGISPAADKGQVS
jgi:hypothetical protein